MEPRDDTADHIQVMEDEYQKQLERLQIMEECYQQEQAMAA